MTHDERAHEGGAHDEGAQNSGLNLLQRLATSSRTAARSVALSGSRSTRPMKAAISAISASPIPDVVMAGVPRRSPLVTNGERGSLGMVLRLHAIPAWSSASCAF